MYVSDYYFSANPIAWTLIGYADISTKDYRAATNVNWLSGYNEWTISRNPTNAVAVYFIQGSGRVSHNFAGNMFNVRPTFYLNSDVTYAFGEETSNSPIRINLD